MERTLRVGDIRALIAESSNEFKAKIGPGVESNNKRNNDEAYRDAQNKANKALKGISGKTGGNKVKFEKNDFNGTTLDYQPENADEEYKKRIKAQALGYTSEAEMNNGLEKSGDYEGNKAIYDGIKKSGQEMHKLKQDNCEIGLVGRERVKKDKDYFKREEMYEAKNLKTVHFKKTEFLSEAHMLSRVPDEFKVDGNIFRMKDKNDSEYIVEWDGKSGVVLEHKNLSGMNESLGRMKSLIGYNSSDYVKSSTVSDRINENDERFTNTLTRMRNLIN